jgi:hypothetical protein
MKNIKKNFAIILIGASLLMLITTACKKDNEENTTPPPTGTADFNVKLSASYQAKATTTYNAINVDIQQISIHISTDTNATSGWFDLETIPGIYNLLDYISSDTLIAFDSLLVVQKVSQIRLILGDNNTVMEDSVTYDLDTPSGQTSGIKIQVHADLLPDSTYVVMLDFDPEKSVKKTGNGKYMLTPVINAVVNP